VETDAGWVARLPGPMTAAIVAVPGSFTGSEDRRPFRPGQIAGFTDVSVDDGTLDRIDAALIASFGL